MRQHLPLATATAAIVATIVLCTWWLGRILSIDSVSERTVEDIERRLQELEVHIENIDASTCSMDKHLMGAGEALNDITRRCR